MRILIDGYNLMHAVVLPARRVGPDALRKMRHRFLNDLAEALGPVDAHQTTIVFDAHTPPGHLPRQTTQKGLTVVFAVGDENADARIEQLIAKHSAPKRLTVVSSDGRVRQAATRRRAKALTADAFWSDLQDRKSRKSGRTPADGPTPEEKARQEGLDAAQADEWMAAFGDIENDPETRQVFRQADFVPTDEEIARIVREVEQESPPDRRKP